MVFTAPAPSHISRLPIEVLEIIFEALAGSDAQPVGKGEMKWTAPLPSRGTFYACVGAEDYLCRTRENVRDVEFHVSLAQILALCANLERVYIYAEWCIFSPAFERAFIELHQLRDFVLQSNPPATIISQTNVWVEETIAHLPPSLRTLGIYADAADIDCIFSLPASLELFEYHDLSDDPEEILDELEELVETDGWPINAARVHRRLEPGTDPGLLAGRIARITAHFIRRGVEFEVFRDA